MAVAVDPGTQAPQPKPIVIFKGEGRRLSGVQFDFAFNSHHLIHHSDGELRKWSRDVKVFFQPKGVVDGALMKEIYEYWGRAFSPEITLLIGDSAKSHWTAEAKEGRPPHVVFGRVEEGITSLTQFLDLSWFAHFKHQCGLLFQTEVEPQLAGKKLSASDPRIIVTRLVSEAHRRVMAVASPKLYESFQSVDFLPVADHSAIKPHPIPSYVFTPVSDIGSGLFSRQFVE